MTDYIKPWEWKTEFGTARVVSEDWHEEEVRELLESDKFFLDTETDGLGNSRKLRLVQIGWKNASWLLDPAQHEELIHDVINSEATFIAHNAPFDLLTLGFHGFEDVEGCYLWAEHKALRGQVIDTMATEQMVHSEPRVKGLSKIAGLEGVHNLYEDEFNDEAARLGFTEQDKYGAIDCNNQYWLRYSAHDIWQLRAAYRRNKKHHTSPSVQDEVMIRVLYEILSSQGMRIDYDKADKLYTRMSKKKAKVMDRLQGIGIQKVYSAAQVASALENLGAVLTERTPTGKPQVNKAVLEEITEGKSGKARKAAKDVTKARSLSTDISRIENLVRNSEPIEDPYGLIHPKLWSIGALTSRSSCSEPNLHQLNKHTGEPEVRGLIIADPDCVMASTDFNTIEICVLADLTGDKKLISRMLNGDDVHGELAKEVGIPRQYAKIGNFAMLYGASPGSIAKQTGMDVEQAIGLREAWGDLYPVAMQQMDAWTEEAYDTGRTVLPNGWAPKIGWTESGNIAAYRAINYQIQGWAAVVFKHAALQLARVGLWRSVRMVVHDEFASSLPRRHAEEMLAAIMEAATVKTKRMVYTTGGELYGPYWGIKEEVAV